MRTWSLVPLALLALATSAQRADAQCPDWRPGFQAPGINGFGHALLVHDGAQGRRLVVGGELDLATAETSGESSVLAWDGVAWESLAGGPPGAVHALVTWDDGTGPAIYAGGEFFSGQGNGVARWNGTSWTPLGTGTNGPVHALAVFDDGSGSALYAGGEFNRAGGQTTGRVARWNGTTWSALGTAPAIGPNNWVHALAVFDDGTGPALFAGGEFTGIGGSGANRVAKWNGASWSALGLGVNWTVNDLIVHDDGSGAALYAGGSFNSAGGQPAKCIARWNGNSWASVGSPGLDGNQLIVVQSLGLYDDGSGGGPKLHASGTFTSAGGAPADGFAIWDGSGWWAPTAGVFADALGTFDPGSGPVLAAVGDFSHAGQVHAVGLALWDGATWAAPSSGQGISSVNPGYFGGGLVSAFRVFDDGSGPALYAAGDFGFAGPVAATDVARFDGSTWSSVGAPGLLAIEALEGHDDGSGPALYAGGWTANRPEIRRWNGSAWSSFGPPLQGLPYEGILTVRAFDDGSGPLLYAGGNLSGVGGAELARIGRWDGSTWSGLGTGTNGLVTCLEVFDDGTGPALYVGGGFTTAGGIPAQGVARWNGTTWSSVGSGPTGVAYALHAFDDGSGAALYVGGRFSQAGGVVARNAARWDGTSWFALGGGVQYEQYPDQERIWTLASYDEGSGSGPALYAGGAFDHAGGVATHGIARWDGAAWSDVGGGVFHTVIEHVLALDVFDDGSGNGPDLFVGGFFEAAGNRAAASIAAWSGCDEVGRTLCYGDGSGTACPCGNASAPGDRDGCLNSTGLGGRLRAEGAPSLANDTLVLSGSRMTNGSALYFQGTAHVNGGAGAAFGDGLRCAAGSVVRLAILANAGGASHYPRAGDPPVATQGSVAQPGVRVYQAWFRDAASFCTQSTFDLTNAVEIVWGL